MSNEDNNNQKQVKNSQPQEDVEQETQNRKELTIQQGAGDLFSNTGVTAFLILWVFLTIARLLSVVSHPPQSPLEKIDADLRVIDNVTIIQYYESKVPGSEKVFEVFRGQLLDIFDKLVERNPKNEKYIYRYLILLASQGKKEEAYEVFKEKRKYLKDKTMVEIFKKFYLFDTKTPISSQQVNLMETSAKKHLHGWFLYNTLMKIYKVGNKPRKAELLKKDIAQRVPMVSVGIIGFFLLSASFFIGILALAGLSFLSWVKYPQISLKNSGIRMENGLFSPLNLKKAVIVFVTWDIVREVGGYLLSLLAGSPEAQNHVPPSLMFVYYILFNSLIVYFIYRVIWYKNIDVDLRTLGLPLKKIGKVFRDFFIGVFSYTAALPVIFAGLMAYQRIFNETPRSANPALHLIKAIQEPSKLVFLFLVIGIVGPIFEEILFRGVLYGAIRKYMSAGWAIITSSFIFALVHYDLGSIFPLFLLGCILALIYERTSSIIPSMVTHCIWNSMTFIVFSSLMN